MKRAETAPSRSLIELQQQYNELEEQASQEVGELHDELLQAREKCNKLEQALKSSENKRCPHLPVSFTLVSLLSGRPSAQDVA